MTNITSKISELQEAYIHTNTHGLDEFNLKGLNFNTRYAMYLLEYLLNVEKKDLNDEIVLRQQ